MDGGQPVSAGEQGSAPLVLVHIPRTAGTTLAMILRHHYRGGAFKGGGNVFARWDQVDARLREIASRPGVRAVSGHLTFGLADRLPPSARYLSILRNPVDRALSHHHVLRQSRAGGDGQRVRTGLVPPVLQDESREVSLEEAVAEGGLIPDNLQTRMLCGIVSPYEDLPGDALERAKRNLRERFAYVGTTERFDEFLALLNVELGWPTLPYKRSRAYLGRPDRADLPPRALRLVEERNALDAELYACAGELLDEALSRAGDGLETELEVVRVAAERWRAGGASSAVEGVRSLSVEARVALALKEGELMRANVEIRDLGKRVKRIERRGQEA
jgi:hypothetical protein